MCFLIEVLLAVSLLSCQVCGQVDCNTESFTSPPPTCPGDQLMFYCSAYDTSDPTTGITVWTVNAPVQQCTLEHTQWPMNDSAVCGSFQAQASGESPEDCFISTLNTTASLSLDGVEVGCTSFVGSPMEVGRGTINITGPVETTNVSCETVQNDNSPNTRYLNISWTTVEDFPSQTSRYVVSVLPLEQNGTEVVNETRPGSSEFTNKQLEVEVETGTEYQITVRADNCGDRQQGNNYTITGFTRPTPSEVSSVRQVYVYNVSSENLELLALDVTIDIMDPNTQCTAGPIEILTVYFNLSTVNNSFTISRNNDTYCSATVQQCSYTYVLPTNLSMTQFDGQVYVTVSNIAGESLPTSQSLLSSMLDNVNVHINSTASPLHARITVTDGFTLKNCLFRFGTDETHKDLPRNGIVSINSTTEVTFDLGNPEDSTYHYNLSCVINSNITLVIQGMFLTNCSETDLADSNAVCSGPAGFSCLLVDEGVEADVVFNKNTAQYRVHSSSHCLLGQVIRRCMSDGEWSGEEPSFPEETSERKLEAWQIVLVVIGIVSYLIGSAACSVLGTMLVLRASTRIEGVIGVVMLVVSVITFPVFLISYCIVKKREWDENEVKLKPFYKLLITVSMVITVVTVICWIVLIAYVASNEFHDDGYLRGHDGVCVATDSDTQKTGRTVLVIVCLILSLLVALEWCVGAAMWRWGTVDNGPATTESTDSGKPPTKPKRSKKLKQKEAEEQELQTYDTLQHGKIPSSPTPLLDPSDPTYGHLQQKEEGDDQADEYSHIQRGGKPKAVPNPEDPNYSHFKQGGGGGGEEYSQLNRGKGVSTLPGAVPAPSDPSYGKLKKEEEEPSEYDVVTNEPRHKPRKRGEEISLL